MVRGTLPGVYAAAWEGGPSTALWTARRWDGAVPFQQVWATSHTQPEVRLMGDRHFNTIGYPMKDAQSDGWTRYNFAGYEGRNAYGEYKALVDQMKVLGEDSTHGCGRAMWENNGDNGQYGTTMALMLLPHWTDGCIASMEGLFFEASGTRRTLRHCGCDQQNSPIPCAISLRRQRDAKAVPYLQTRGVKYEGLPKGQGQSDTRPELTNLARSGRGNLHPDSDLVVPLAGNPSWSTISAGPSRKNWNGDELVPAPDEWAAIPPNDGPPNAAHQCRSRRTRIDGLSQSRRDADRHREPSEPIPEVLARSMSARQPATSSITVANRGPVLVKSATSELPLAARRALSIAPNWMSSCRPDRWALTKSVAARYFA